MCAQLQTDKDAYKCIINAYALFPTSAFFLQVNYSQFELVHMAGF